MAVWGLLASIVAQVCVWGMKRRYSPYRASSIRNASHKAEFANFKNADNDVGVTEPEVGGSLWLAPGQSVRLLGCSRPGLVPIGYTTAPGYRDPLLGASQTIMSLLLLGTATGPGAREATERTTQASPLFLCEVTG